MTRTAANRWKLDGGLVLAALLFTPMACVGVSGLGLPVEGAPLAPGADGSPGVEGTGDDSVADGGLSDDDASADALVAATSPCAPGKAYCPSSGQCVDECTDCANAPVACFAVAPGAAAASGTCVPSPTPTACLSAGNARPSCATSSDCPGDFQICFALSCFSCGEAQTDGMRCKDGHRCDTNSGNPDDRFTCY